MKMKNIVNGIVLLFLLTFVSSCVDKDFDEPPIGGTDPAGVAANTTIAQLKTYYAGSGTVTKIPDGVIIAGIVVSSDETGNFYKELVIQDATGGILIRVDRSSTYVLMPVGRRIFVICTGLYISDYGSMIQIGVKGSGGVDRIPALLIDQHLLRGQWGQPVPLRTIQDINNIDLINDQNTLIRIDSVYFDPADVCATWADASTSATNRTLKDKVGLLGNVILVRSSSFATFAANFIPGGTGSIVGIYQNYGTTKQFRIRDLKDVIGFPTSTCGPPAGPTITIAGLRALYTGVTGTPIPSGMIIKGVVISDKDNSNITAKNVVIQDATGGIVVRFTSNNTFSKGNEVIIDVSGKVFTDFNGLLEADQVGNSSAFLLQNNVPVTPRVATLADINANANTWESTLVKILGVTISGGGTYSGTTTLNDGTGTLPMFSYSTSSFATTAYPVTPVTVTGIVSDFNGAQLNMRSSADVQP